MQEKKITVAGTVIVDNVKTIDSYPERGMLSNISSVKRCIGGCVPNTAIDLAKFGGVKVKAVGRVGNDGDGKFVLNTLSAHGVDTDNIIITEGADTSFTDVMTVRSTGERTFFNTRGANALFSPSDISADALDCDIFHIGYLLLLDNFDKPDAEYGTAMARFLHTVRSRGVKTSIDVVSDSGGKFGKVVLPALKHCDYAVLNEIEAGLAVGIEPRDKSGKLIPGNVEKILKEFNKLGVRVAVVHCPEAGFMSESGKECVCVPSLDLPKDYIKGSVGAGDAFCAGVLYSLLNGFDAEKTLRFASCSAAANLAALDSVSGAMPYEETAKLDKIYKRKILR